MGLNLKEWSSINEDLIALALCVYLLIGDTKQIFIKQLSNPESMGYDERHKLITNDKFKGS